MITCVHDPIDGRGEAKAPFHQVKSKLHATIAHV
jgi:hypothetical protein